MWCIGCSQNRVVSQSSLKVWPSLMQTGWQGVKGSACVNEFVGMHVCAGWHPLLSVHRAAHVAQQACMCACMCVSTYQAKGVA